MSDKDRCPDCGAVIPAGAPAGQCPQCMLKAGFESAAPGSTAFEPPPVDVLAKLFPLLEVLELVGQGGMGAVYKARQPGLDRLVAVKILPQEVGGDPAFADRFTREARALARLSHPNIVAIYDFGQKEGLFYFVMEYVDGANLRQTITSGKLKPNEALAIVPQICDALQFAHDEGIVHRDIKPENVLIDMKGRVKIADFGLAKLLGEEQIEATLTQTNQVMGTLRYMAPEQMQHTHDVDHRADIYSLGVVFYELLTGTVPMGRFDPPSRMVQVDVRLDEVVLRALAQEPDKRYQHAREVKTDVEMLASEPAPVRLPPPHEAGQTSNWKPGLEDTRSGEADLEAARQELNNPAMGLVVVGVLTCLTAVVPMLIAVKTLHDVYDGRITFVNDDGFQEAVSPSPSAPSSTSERATPSDQLEPSNEERAEQTSAEASANDAQLDSGVLQRGMSLAGVLRHAVLIVLVLLLPSLGIIITWGGWTIQHVRSRGLAVTASILALLPCQPVFILGPIFGIWSLIVLNRSRVRAAFKEMKGVPPITQSKEPIEEPAEKPAQDYVGTGIAMGIALGAGIGTAMDNIGVSASPLASLSAWPSVLHYPWPTPRKTTPDSPLRSRIRSLHRRFAVN